MIDPEHVYQYYLSDKFRAILPPKTSWRHFRFRLADKGWRKVPRKIQDIDELRRWIIKLGGLDLYYSTSCWLNPHKAAMMGKSGSYHIADNLLLHSDLVFDVDAKDPVGMKTVDDARKSAYNIYCYMKQHTEYELQYVAFTGHKGFRLVYSFKGQELPATPGQRLDYIVNKRKTFIQQMLLDVGEKPSLLHFRRTGVFFDKDITTNPMCVIRLLGSVHSTTGYISCEINPTDLLLPLTKILDKVPFITPEGPGIPEREMTKDSKKAKKPSSRTRLEQSDENATGPASHPFHYFISNKVLGIKKGFVPFFIYQDNQTYYEKELIRLQKKHRLGAVYLYKIPHHTMAISIKCMQRRQLQKVLNDSSSKTKYTFLKYRRIYAPFSLNLVKILKAPYFTSHLSRAHASFVGARHKDADLCGWPNVELVQGVRTNG
jgi:hypothetical protein